jgi:hypothetical protein
MGGKSPEEKRAQGHPEGGDHEARRHAKAICERAQEDAAEIEATLTNRSQYRVPDGSLANLSGTVMGRRLFGAKTVLSLSTWTTATPTKLSFSAATEAKGVSLLKIKISSATGLKAAFRRAMSSNPPTQQTVRCWVARPVQVNATRSGSKLDALSWRRQVYFESRLISPTIQSGACIGIDYNIVRIGDTSSPKRPRQPRVARYKTRSRFW